MKTIFSWKSENYSFEFIEDSKLPPDELVTCCFWLIKIWEKICLTKNYRWWEFPWWHREAWEPILSALKREIKEEIWADILSPKLIWYKKITNKSIQKNREWWYYPFPNSYIVFYIASTNEIKQYDLCPESFDAKLCSYKEARKLISIDNQKLLDYLYKYKN